jgi:hypothetical protein
MTFHNFDNFMKLITGTSRHGIAKYELISQDINPGIRGDIGLMMVVHYASHQDR